MIGITDQAAAYSCNQRDCGRTGSTQGDVIERVDAQARSATCEERNCQDGCRRAHERGRCKRLDGREFGGSYAVGDARCAEPGKNGTAITSDLLEFLRGIPAAP